MNNIQSLTDDPEDMPQCPLCDQPIFSYEESRIVTAFVVKYLAHEDCYQEAVSDE